MTLPFFMPFNRECAALRFPADKLCRSDRNWGLNSKFMPGLYPLLKLLNVFRLAILSSLLTLEINFLVFSSPRMGVDKS
jgi:hypothetical protein